MSSTRLAAIIVTCAVSACTSSEPISETGFHENLPGAFNYFVDPHPSCGSISSNGDTCSYLYDEQNRLVHLDCEGLYVSDIVYSENPSENTVTKTEVIQGYIEGRDQTDVDIYTLEKGVVISRHRTTIPESYPMTSTTYDYVRDSSSRLEILELSGSVTGSTFFAYDEETGLLSKSTFTGDSMVPSYDDYDTEYDWEDGLLSEVRWTSPLGLTSLMRYSYNEFGEPVSNERIDEDGVSVTWSDDPACGE